MYAGQEGYRDAGNGPYTLYVDNRSADCSDDGPGTESEPLCQIPRSLPDPGTVVEIHGGPYGTNRDALRMRVSGERDRPVFIRGVDDGEGFPVIKDANVFFAAGQYFIVENLRFIGTAVGTGAPRTPASEHHHIAIRNNEIARHPRKNGSGLRGTDVVFYGNHVHHNQGDDRHGTIVAPGAERVWIVDNY